MAALFLRAAPYAKDALDLPVADVAAAIPYYEKTFRFTVVSRQDQPHKSAYSLETRFRLAWLRMEAIQLRKAVSLKWTTL